VAEHQPGMEAYEALALRLARGRRYPASVSGRHGVGDDHCSSIMRAWKDCARYLSYILEDELCCSREQNLDYDTADEIRILLLEKLHEKSLRPLIRSVRLGCFKQALLGRAMYWRWNSQ